MEVSKKNVKDTTDTSTSSSLEAEDCDSVINSEATKKGDLVTDSVSTEDGSLSDTTTILAPSSSDEDTLAEMEAAGWLRLMNDVHSARDRAIDAIAEMVERRNKILKPKIKMASDYCLSDYEPGFELIIKSLNDFIQAFFETNSIALKYIVKEFDAKTFETKSLLSNRIKNTYKVLPKEKTITTSPPDTIIWHGIAAFACICMAILCFLIMILYPNSYDPSYTYFFFKLLTFIGLFVFAKSFIYYIRKYENGPRKLQK